MSEPQFYGRDLQQGWDSYLWDPRAGYRITRPYYGSQAQIESAALLAKGQGLAHGVEAPGPNEGLWKLTITYGAQETQPSNEPLSDVWELVGNMLEKRLWQLPDIRAEFDKIKDDVGGGVTRTEKVRFIKYAIEQFLAGTPKIAGLSNQTGSDEFDLTDAWLFGTELVTIGVDPAPFRKLVEIMAQGVEVFPISQFVLRRTRVVASNYNIVPEYNFVDLRQTTDSLEARLQLPTTLKFHLPDGEWVQQTPTVNQTSSSKWTITEEWWHADQWEPFIYGDLV